MNKPAASRADHDSPFDDLPVAVSRGEPLAPHTWLGIGGEAAWFCEPVDVDALAGVVGRCHDRSIPLRVIGGGSNILVAAAGFSGMVVRLSAPAFCDIAVEPPLVKAGAGAKLVHVVSAAVQAVSGRSLEAFAGERLFVPLGIGGWRWERHGDGVTFGVELQGALGLVPQEEEADELRWQQVSHLVRSGT